MSDDPASSYSDRLRRLLPDPERVRRRVQEIGPRLQAGARELRRRVQPGGDTQSLDELDESFVEEGAETVTETDIDTVVEEAEAIEERFRENGPLRRLLEDGRLLLGLIQDVRQGQYRHVPVWTLSAAAFTLLYVLNPFDAVPDALPVLGVLDDAAVVSACLALLEQDLHEYKRWRKDQIEANSGSKTDRSRTHEDVEPSDNGTGRNEG